MKKILMVLLVAIFTLQADTVSVIKPGETYKGDQPAIVIDQAQFKRISLDLVQAKTDSAARQQQNIELQNYSQKEALYKANASIQDTIINKYKL